MNVEDFEATSLDTTTDFRGLDARRRGFFQRPNSTRYVPFTSNRSSVRSLLVINNFCAQESDRKPNSTLPSSTLILSGATRRKRLVVQRRYSTLSSRRFALSILLFSEKHPHGPTTDSSNKTRGRRRHLETNFPFLDIPR